MRIKILLTLFLIFVSKVELTTHGESNSQIDVVIIVHKNRPKLSRTQIRLIFTGYLTTWPNGGKIRIIINRNTALKEKFLHEFLNMSTSQFNRLWEKKKIRDGISLPREGSSDVIKTLVASSPKYIGFIQGAELSSSFRVVAP